MTTYNEPDLFKTLLDVLDSAVSVSTEAVRKCRMNWLSGISRGDSANEATYRNQLPKRKGYRKSVKKSAIVRTIHSILSRKCQNVLSKETGAGAAWLLGLWPFSILGPGVKTGTPSQQLFFLVSS